MEIHADLLGLFQTPDMTPGWHWHDRTKMLRDWLIFQGKTKKQTNKQKRTASFLSIHLWPGHVINEYCNIQWIWRQNSVLIPKYNKLSSVFDKLGLGSKYREGTAFQHPEWTIYQFLVLSFFHYFLFLCYVMLCYLFCYYKCIQKIF